MIIGMPLRAMSVPAISSCGRWPGRRRGVNRRAQHGHQDL
jgi:hypothetical protein